MKWNERGKTGKRFPFLPMMERKEIVLLESFYF